MVFTMMKVH